MNPAPEGRQEDDKDTQRDESKLNVLDEDDELDGEREAEERERGGDEQWEELSASVVGAVELWWRVLAWQSAFLDGRRPVKDPPLTEEKEYEADCSDGEDELRAEFEYLRTLGVSNSQSVMVSRRRGGGRERRLLSQRTFRTFRTCVRAHPKSCTSVYSVNSTTGNHKL